MEALKVTAWEWDLAQLWKAIVLDQAPPKWGKQAGDAPREVAYSSAGQNWLKKALSDGVVWWLSQGVSPQFLSLSLPLAPTSADSAIALPALTFSNRSLGVLSGLLVPVAAEKKFASFPPSEMPAIGDRLLETIVGTWLRDWQPARFASFESTLDSTSLALISLLAVEPVSVALQPITWIEDLLVCLSSRLALAWETRWHRFHKQLGQARTLAQVEALGRLTNLFVGCWIHARERERLDPLRARLVRLAATTLTTMNVLEAFSPDIDWQTMTVIDRQALKRRSHLAFALGSLMERQYHAARKTSYLSDDYPRAQDELRMFAIAAELPWSASVKNLDRLWSSDIAGDAAMAGSRASS